MILAYKAFDPDLSCTVGDNRFQYYLGRWNEEPEANCAKNGFHCAENPLDCLTYYPDWNHAVYYLVLADGDLNEDGWDSKISCTKLKLVKQLDLREFVAHSLRYLYEHPYMKNTYHIRNEYGEAARGFVIVRGKEPMAKGKQGDILGFAREHPESGKIQEIGLYIVDGADILADTWYDVEGNETDKKGAIHEKEITEENACDSAK